VDGERLERIEELYHAARERDPVVRAAFLREACGDDEELRTDVEGLLAQDAVKGPLERPAWTAATVQSASAFLLPAEGGATTIGRYRLLEKIGEGGMGEVWLAEQMEPVRRRVALKLVKTGMNTREVIARFGSERQALALMDHPAIATVFDAGSTEQGMPYFAMEYVDGVPITTYCDNHRLTTRERVELFMRVCEGVQHAHQKAIIHRDLKPSNILVTEVDGRATPKIIDFGIAKALTQKLTADTVFTRLGAIVGTPEYMSPEQALSSGEDIDTRTDVYSLGIILYELLAGAPPFELRKVTLEELLRRLREEEPPKLSTRIRTQAAATSEELARKRQTEPPALARQLRGELDSIALKALEKDRSRRYGSPSDLAADIGRYLNNEPVLAVSPSVAYRARKFARRYRTGVAVAATAVLFLASFVVAQSVQVQRVTRERDRANRERDRANRITDFMTNMFRQADPGHARGSMITAREVLDRASQDLNRELVKEPELRARMIYTIGNVYETLGMYSKAESLLVSSLDTGRRVLGSNNPDILATQALLGFVYLQERRRSQAEKLLRATLNRSLTVLGPAHKTTWSAMNYLGNTLSQEGKGPEAEKLVRTAVDIERRVLGPGDPDTVTSTDRLASVLQVEGKFVEAEKLHRQTLDLRRHLYGRDHPATALSLHNLANSQAAESHFAEAEKLYREGMEIDLHVLGPEHPETLQVMNDLANDLSDQGHYQEAEKLNRRVLEARRRVFGPDHPFTASTIYNLGCLAALTGRHKEAISLLSEAVDRGLDADLDLHMDRDSDLKSLHGDPRFTALVAHAKERAPTAPPRLAWDPTFSRP
jgi:non-specific serine/threonine protein kinase/serine/threonine-protein kinase